MTEMIKVFAHFEKAVGDDGVLHIEGYANTTSKDRHGDVILDSAWEGEGLANYVKNPIILAFHNHSKPIGKMVEHQITPKGLYIKAAISKAATDIYDLIKDNVLSTFSVGISVKDAEYDSATDIFVIKELELHEISVVSVPANADSTFIVSKQLRDQMIAKGNEIIEVEVDKERDLMQENQIKELTDAVAVLAEQVSAQAKEKEVEPKIEVGATSVEKLEAELEKRVSDILAKREADLTAKASLEQVVKEHAEMKSALDGLRTELAEKGAEMEAFRASKMHYAGSDRQKVSESEIDKAVMLAKVLNKDITETKFGKALLEKAGSDLNAHIPATDWETSFSDRLYDNVRQRLVLAPLFSSIVMTSLNLHIPINPDPAADATWVARTAYGTANSSGVAKVTALSEVIMKAHKLSTHEYLIDEEEEDAIIAVAGIIRDSMARRMGRTLDKGYLRGQDNEGGADPINGMTKVANTGSAEVVLPGVIATAKVTVADLQTTRRALGVWGLDPSNVVYVVSTDAYFDLLDDPDFRTVDLVGISATILRGQIGMVNGSPVLVSGEFAAKAVDVAGAVVINKEAFLGGSLRGMRLERDREVVAQREVLVASTRVGFVNLIAGKGAAALNYPAS